MAQQVAPWKSVGELRRFWHLARPLGGEEFVYQVLSDRWGAEKLHEIARARFLWLMRHMEELQAAEQCRCGAEHGTASCAQWRRLMYLRRRLGWDEARFSAYVRKYAHVDALRWLTAPKARGLITGMGKIVAKEEEDGESKRQR